MNISQEYDIAIVGGGLAGLYCGLNVPPGLKVAIFEATDRLGGKIETVPMAGFQAEYGAMRFDPGRQPLIGGLLKELGLETQPFPEYSAPPSEERRVAYRLEKSEAGLNPLELWALGIARVLNKSVAELMATSEEELEELRRRGKHRGKYLWEQGVWNVFVDVLSYDAIRYIMADGSFFHGIHENPGVAGTMINWVKMLQMSPHLKGVKGGMEGITRRMFDRVKARGVEVHTGQFLQGLAPARGKKVSLVFSGGTLTARKVILALPATALKALKGLPEEIRALLNSVIEYPLLKCFFIVKDPWWEEDVPNRGVLTFPARELHYSRRDGMGNIMAYNDRPSINFWNKYILSKRHDKAEINGHPELPLVFANRMNISPERVLSYGIRDWRREPYGAGVHLWRAGFEPWKVIERFEAFSLSEGRPQNVHICGEAFSDYQGFMEGALRTAKSALTKALS